MIGTILIVACRLFSILVGIDFPIGGELRNKPVSLLFPPLRTNANTLVIEFLNISIFGQSFPYYEFRVIALLVAAGYQPDAA